MQNQEISISQPILTLITEIDQFKAYWHTVSANMSLGLIQLKKIATIESISSSTRIEGVKLTNNEVEDIFNNIGKMSFKSRDEQEVAGYAELMNIIFDNWQNLPISENYIKHFHKILLQYSEKDQRHMGEYKSVPNHVAAFDEKGKEIGIIFETATPFETKEKMRLLLEWLNSTILNKELHPLVMIAVFIVNFLAIHPFKDGNGRLSRILTSFLLLKCDYAFIPYSSFEAIIEQNKDAYYRALRATQITLKEKEPDYDPWLSFFCLSLLRVVNRLKAKIEETKMQNFSPKVVQEYIDLPTISANILKILDKNQRITIKELQTALNVSELTIKKHIQNLTRSGKIIKHGTTKGVWYTKDL